MKRLAVLSALALTIVPFVTSGPAHAASGDLSTVSITVSMDLPSSEFSKGPAVWQVQNVKVADGPELTGADLVSNPSDWGGSVTVDVDNASHHITVATEKANDFETATVTVTGAGLGTVSLVSDDLWIPEQLTGAKQAAIVDDTTTTLADTTTTVSDATMPLVLGVAPDTAIMHWSSSVAGVFWELNKGGAAVFSFALAAPTTTVAPTTTAPPAAAAAVQATPAFTG